MTWKELLDFARAEMVRLKSRPFIASRRIVEDAIYKSGYFKHTGWRAIALQDAKHRGLKVDFSYSPSAVEIDLESQAHLADVTAADHRADLV